MSVFTMFYPRWRFRDRIDTDRRWVRLVIVMLVVFCALAASASAQQVATPVFTPAEGDASVYFSVVVTTSTSGASIYYTTDGSDPSEQSSLVPGDGRVTVGRTLTLKAKAYLNGWTPSAIQTAFYRVTGAVEAGGKHVQAIKTDRTLWGWGEQGSGRLANGATATGNVYLDPTRAYSAAGVYLNDVVDAAAGYTFSVAVDGSGRVWAWGDNVNGAVGDNTTADKAYATRVLKSNVTYNSAAESDFLGTANAGGLKLTGVSAGNAHGAAVESGNGRVWTWGQRNNGRLGDGYVSSTSSLRKYAATVQTTDVGNPELSGVVQVAVGQVFTLALANLDIQGRGQVWAWGDNTSGQLGQGNSTTIGRAVRVKRDSTATTYPTGNWLNDVVDIAAGWDHSLAIRQDNAGQTTVWAWGQRANGRLGNTLTVPGSAGDVTYPVQVITGSGAPLTGVIQVSGGPRHSIALDNQGNVWAWGYNQDGNLGDGATTHRSYAAKVQDLSDPTGYLTGIVRVSAGGYETQTTNPDGSVTVTVNSFNVALKADGTVYGWGFNANGETGTGSTASPIKRAQASPFSTKFSNRSPSTSLSISGISTLEQGSFNLTASPSDADGNLSRVDFFRNGSFLGSRSISPWTWTASGLLAGSHTFTATAVDSFGATGFSAGAVGTVTLPTLTSSVQTSSTSEGSGTPARFRVTRSGGAGDLTVSYTVSSGSTATVGTDYTALSGSVIIPNGQTFADITVSALADNAVEGNETVTIQIQGGRYTIAPDQVERSITIIDVPPTVAVSTVQNAAEQGETPVAGIIRFSRSGPMPAMTVTYTVGGTATAGSDYTPALSGTLSFTQNQTSIDLSITPLIDRVTEGDETVVVTLSAGGAVYAVSAPGTATVTIQDAPPLDVPTFSPADSANARISAVRVNAASGSTIRYTTDGSEPTQLSPSVAAGSLIAITSPATIKAKASKAGMTPSLVGTGSWSGAMDVAAGNSHSLLIDKLGRVWAWGVNWNGQLGLGNTDATSTPALLTTITGVKAIAAGDYHSVAVKSNGTVWTWGGNWSGQLGNGTTTDTYSPGQLAGIADAVAVAAGGNHTAVLRSNGAVLTWGGNSYGQLGDGNTADSIVPVTVSISNVRAVSAGEYHTLALKSDGTVWAWGANFWGQLGDNSWVDKTTPVQVSGLMNVVAISAGSAHSLALKADGTVWAWGSNDNWQIRGASGGSSLVPIQVPGITGVVAIAAGAYHAAAIKSDGAVWCWGANSNGQSAVQATVSTVDIGQAPNLTVARALAARYQNLVLTNDGSLWVWGGNNTGQLGDGSNTDKDVPFALPSLIADADQDGLPDYLEAQIGSNANDADSNDDGINDGDAYAARGATMVVNTDNDGDGISNYQEYQLGTNPFWNDSDGDGVLDGVDAFPLDPTRSQAPASNPSDTTAPVITITYPATGITPL